MYFPKFLALVTITLAANALAAPAPVAAPDAIAEPAEGKNLHARGFGCPGDEDECNDHCRSLEGGRTGGYCGGILWTTCTCIFG